MDQKYAVEDPKIKKVRGGALYPYINEEGNLYP